MTVCIDARFVSVARRIAAVPAICSERLTPNKQFERTYTKCFRLYWMRPRVFSRRIRRYDVIGRRGHITLLNRDPTGGIGEGTIRFNSVAKFRCQFKIGRYNFLSQCPGIICPVLDGKAAPLIEAATVCNTWILSSLARAFRRTAGEQINAVAPPKIERRESKAISPNTRQIEPNYRSKRNRSLLAASP